MNVYMQTHMYMRVCLCMYAFIRLHVHLCMCIVIQVHIYALCVVCIQPTKVWGYEYRGAIARWTAQWREDHAQGMFKYYVPVKSSLLVEAFASPYALLNLDYERLEILGKKDVILMLTTHLHA